MADGRMAQCTRTECEHGGIVVVRFLQCGDEEMSTMNVITGKKATICTSAESPFVRVGASQSLLEWSMLMRIPSSVLLHHLWSFLKIQCTPFQIQLVKCTRVYIYICIRHEGALIIDLI